MKLTSLMIVAVALAGSIGAATPAAADRVVVQERTVTHHESGWHRKHRVCTVERHGHQRVRRCFWR